jgi:hypothetical protein
VSLHSVSVGCVADVSEEHSALVVRVEMYTVGEFKWIYRFMFQRNHGREIGVGVLCRPTRTVKET